MSDPNLKTAMAQIRAILNEHDIGGAVTLVSPTHCEFYFHLSPSWSICYFNGPELRFRARRRDFTTAEEQQRCVELTVHLIHQIRDMNVQSFTQMERVIDMLKEHFDIDHKPYSGFEPHREQ